jgi:hypothetical protein
MSYAQCPVCALRFRFQSELETHAHDDHCLRATCACRRTRSARGARPASDSRLLRLP